MWQGARKNEDSGHFLMLSLAGSIIFQLAN